MSIGTPFGRGRELPDSYGAWLFVVTRKIRSSRSPYPSPPRGHSPRGVVISAPTRFQRSTQAESHRKQVNASRPVEAHACSIPRPLVKHERNNASAVASVVARAQGAPETGGRPERQKQSLEPVAQMWHIRSEIRGDRWQASTVKPQVRGDVGYLEQCFDRPSSPPVPGSNPGGGTQRFRSSERVPKWLIARDAATRQPSSCHGTGWRPGAGTLRLPRCPRCRHEPLRGR